jgi:hypothetical protein
VQRLTSVAAVSVLTLTIACQPAVQSNGRCRGRCCFKARMVRSSSCGDVSFVLVTKRSRCSQIFASFEQRAARSSHSRIRMAVRYALALYASQPSYTNERRPPTQRDCPKDTAVLPAGCGNILSDRGRAARVAQRIRRPPKPCEARPRCWRQAGFPGKSRQRYVHLFLLGGMMYQKDFRTTIWENGPKCSVPGEHYRLFCVRYRR